MIQTLDNRRAATSETSRAVLFTHNNRRAFLLPMSPYLYAISDELYDALARGADPLLADPFRGEIELLKTLGYYPVGKAERAYSFFGASLNLINGCNMACTYCCVGPSGQYGKSRVQKMPVETALKSVDFLLEQSGNKRLQLAFFGGEPLLNLEAITESIRYAMKKGCDREWYFKLVTNGTMITDEVAQMLAKYNVSSTITIDGTKEIHDRQRPMAGGGPTYDLIVRNLGIMKRHGAEFFIKCVVAKDSDVDKKQLRDKLTELTGDERRVSVSWENGTQQDPSSMDRYYEEKLREAAEEKGLFLKGEGGHDYSHIVFQVFQMLTASDQQYDMCTAGIGYVQIAPDGEMFSCHIAEAMGKFRVGNVHTGFTEEYAKVREQFLTPPKKCQSCWANYMCMKECNISRALRPRVDPDPRRCEWTFTVIRDAVEVIMDMDKDFLAELTEDFYPEDARRVIDAWRFREELWRSLRHIKPYLLFPRRDDLPQGKWISSLALR